MSRRLLLLAALLCSASVSAAQPAAPERAVRDEVIYEMFVRNLTPEGTLAAAARRLPAIRDLGATTVWLMPIHPIGEVQRKGTLGSPYAVRDYSAVSDELGTVDDLRAFVDAAHALGMRVVLDWVANHTAWDHRWMTEHPSWYTRDSTGTVVPPVADWYDVADLNYDNPEVGRAMTAAMRFWIERAGIDGFRCDVAEMVPLDFWRTAIAELRTLRPDLLMLAEGQEPHLYDAGFNLTYDWPLYSAMKDVWRGDKPASAIGDALRTGAERYGEHVRMRFTTNHDETAWDKPPVVLFSGTRGAAAAYWTVGLLPGVPLVYNGQEGGSVVQTGLFDRNLLPPFDARTLDLYDTVLELRDRHDVLRRGDLVLLDAGADVLMFERVLGDERVLVAVNTRRTPSTVAVPAAVRERYNGVVGRRGRVERAPVAVDEVRDLTLTDDDATDGDAEDFVPRIGSLTVPETLGLAGFEVRTFGTLVLRTR